MAWDHVPNDFLVVSSLTCSTSRNPTLRLQDILDASIAVEEYLPGYDYKSFVSDRRTVDAVIRNLEITGEAVKHLPEELTGDFPDIPWHALAGFRDILAHSYFRREDSIIWDSATVHNPSLIRAARKLPGQYGPANP